MNTVFRFAFVLTAFVSSIGAFAEPAPAMVAHFIDVGQGDSTLLEFPCGAVLIDAGAQDKDRVQPLLDYLDAFFARRTDLNKTIAVLFVTHTHIDHNAALREICQRYTVPRYADNGEVRGSGKANAKWMRDQAAAGTLATKVIELRDADVVKADPAVGLTNDDIDPVHCGQCDPRIAVLSGGIEKADNPGWSESEFENQNNQSVAIRIDFGASSFLFTGDMEESALDTLVEYYEDQAHSPKTLDVDVYHVGHHGSSNGTTQSLLDAMTPKIAVISMGQWDYGKPSKAFSTWSYGHPRATVVDMLKEATTRRRSTAKDVHVFERAKKPVTVTIRKAVYATGWDGTVDIRATLDGDLRVTTAAN